MAWCPYGPATAVKVHVALYDPAYALPGTTNEMFSVDCWSPIPVPEPAETSSVAVGAVVPTGMEYGYEMEVPPLGSVHVPVPFVQLHDGAGNDGALEMYVLVPVRNSVPVAVTFQPLPHPELSSTCSVSLSAAVWLLPFNVTVPSAKVGVVQSMERPASELPHVLLPEPFTVSEALVAPTVAVLTMMAARTRRMAPPRYQGMRRVMAMLHVVWTAVYLYHCHKPIAPE